MKTENFEKIAKNFVTSVKKIEYVDKFDFYRIVVSGAVTIFELNNLAKICRVSHVSCSETGCVEVICKAKNDIYVDNNVSTSTPSLYNVRSQDI